MYTTFTAVWYSPSTSLRLVLTLCKNESPINTLGLNFQMLSHIWHTWPGDLKRHLTGKVTAVLGKKCKTIQFFVCLFYWKKASSEKYRALSAWHLGIKVREGMEKIEYPLRFCLTHWYKVKPSKNISKLFPILFPRFPSTFIKYSNIKCLTRTVLFELPIYIENVPSSQY